MMFPVVELMFGTDQSPNESPSLPSLTKPPRKFNLCVIASPTSRRTCFGTQSKTRRSSAAFTTACDFYWIQLDASQPCLECPSTITKHRRSCFGLLIGDRPTSAPALKRNSNFTSSQFASVPSPRQWTPRRPRPKQLQQLVVTNEGLPKMSIPRLKLHQIRRI